jgi:hypothetical protein
MRDGIRLSLFRNHYDNDLVVVITKYAVVHRLLIGIQNGCSHRFPNCGPSASDCLPNRQRDTIFVDYCDKSLSQYNFEHIS